MEPAFFRHIGEQCQWEQEVERRLGLLPPATLDSPHLTTQHLQAYHQHLELARSPHLGNRRHDDTQWSVFIDEHATKHVMTLHGQTLREWQLDLNGSLQLLTLQREDGRVYHLDCYLGVGLDELRNDPAELARMPGWSLESTRYRREDDRLVDVTTSRLSSQTG